MTYVYFQFKLVGKQVHIFKYYIKILAVANKFLRVSEILFSIVTTLSVNIHYSKKCDYLKKTYGFKQSAD